MAINHRIARAEFLNSKRIPGNRFFICVMREKHIKENVRNTWDQKQRQQNDGTNKMVQKSSKDKTPEKLESLMDLLKHFKKSQRSFEVVCILGIIFNTLGNHERDSLDITSSVNYQDCIQQVRRYEVTCLLGHQIDCFKGNDYSLYFQRYFSEIMQKKSDTSSHDPDWFTCFWSFLSLFAAFIVDFDQIVQPRFVFLFHTGNRHDFYLEHHQDQDYQDRDLSGNLNEFQTLILRW